MLGLIFEVACVDHRDGTAPDSGVATVPAGWEVAEGTRWSGGTDRNLGASVALVHVSPTELAVLIGEPATSAVDTPHEAPEEDSIGAAYLVRRDAPGGDIRDRAAATFEGVGVVDYFGNLVAAVGDLDGDGTEEFAVTAGQTPVDEDGLSEHVFVYSSDAAGTVPSASRFAAIASDWTTDAGYGRAIGRCGDVNHDTWNDLCITTDATGVDPRYEFVVFHGPLEGATLTAADEDLRVQGPRSFGAAISVADRDGDGGEEVVVGAESVDDVGAAYQFDLPPEGVVSVEDIAVEWMGEVEWGYAGATLASGEDLDGDGLIDLFIGAFLADEASGRGYVVFDNAGGPLAEAPIQIVASRAADVSGRAAALCDVDGDDRGDLVVGIPRSPYQLDLPGRVAIFHGPLTPGTYSDTDAGEILIGGTEPDYFGSTLACADLDGDERDDLVVGAPWDPAAGYGAGSVLVLAAPER